MDSALSVIQGVTAALKADDAVAALVADRIYTDVPQKSDFPYVVLSIDSEPFAANDFSGQAHSLTVQVFSQYKGNKEALTIREACHAALDRKESSINLPEGTLVKCEYSGSQTPFKEDDGKTWQAISQFEVVVV